MSVTGRKSPKVLELESGYIEDMYSGSQLKISKATTVTEAEPYLNRIARDNNLTLSNPDDYKRAVAILRS